MRCRIILVVLLFGAACSDGENGHDNVTFRSIRAEFPVALVAEPGGGFLYGERLTGSVRRVDADGRLAPDPVAQIPVVGAIDDQRGLLGLVRLPDGRVFASWTQPDRRLVVGEILGSRSTHVIWLGPASADRSNGGGLAAGPGTTIVIGIGDLLADRSLPENDALPNRKILALDPNGDPTQTPQILSRGWNNPYAIARTPDGTLWAADNAGSREPERIGRADRPAEQAAVLSSVDDTRAPSAIVAFDNQRLGVCGFVSERLDEVTITNGAPAVTGKTITEPCRTGATILANDRIVTATPDAIMIFAP